MGQGRHILRSISDHVREDHVDCNVVVFEGCCGISCTQVDVSNIALIIISQLLS